MSSAGIAIAEGARSLVGTRFRLHGRNPQTGLDCVGLVAESLRLAGIEPRAPHGYALRNADIRRHISLAACNGLAPASGPRQAGDILMSMPGPAQHHLIVALDAEEFVHAHIGLGRVVIASGPLPGKHGGHWRIAGGD